MKKSTLITTIAMIVVVVVALSTATYAWFSSSTTTSVSGEITTTAASDWVIMGASRSTLNGTDSVSYSSTQPIALILMNGLYSPTAEITGTPSSGQNTATFGLSEFFNATQDGIGQVTDAKAATPASVDPIHETGTDISSVANYVRVINTSEETKTLKLTITVITDGSTDSDFYAANGFSTYVSWKSGDSDPGHANTQYYYGSVANSTTGAGEEVYYAATRTGTIAKTANCTYSQAIDAKNANGLGIPSTAYVNAQTTSVTIGGEEITSGMYYQIVITIADADHKIARNQAVNVAFYAWFDGWTVDNSAANANATVYYEFGE